MISDPAPLTPEVRAMLDRAASGRRFAGDTVLRAVSVACPDMTEQVQAGVAAAFRRLCDRIATHVAGHAGLPPAGNADVSGRIANICMRDHHLRSELTATVRLDVIGAALPFDPGADPAGPSLVVRLARSSEPDVARAAEAFLVATNAGRSGAITLSAVAEAGMVWRVAAALRARTGDRSPAIDHALATAARRTIDEHHAAAAPDVTAMRLATAIDARPDELPALIEETLSDREVVLLAAFVAHALNVRFAVARDLLTDPVDDRFLLAMRALDLPRRTIARMGLLLNEADPAGDVEGFADTLETLMRVPIAAAAAAIAPLALDPDYRAAIAALDVRAA